MSSLCFWYILAVEHFVTIARAVPPHLAGALRENEVGTTRYRMRNAIGFIIILWALSHYFSNTFVAADKAAVAALETIEVTARAAARSQ